MGFGLELVIHLFIILVLCCGIAIAGAVITYLLSSKEKRTKNVVFAIVAPFVGLYTFYFLALIGTIIVTDSKKVDANIGDAWYVPLSNECRLIFIDVPQYADIQCDGSPVTISGVSYIAQSGSKIYAETHDQKYFRLHTATKKLEQFPNEADFGNAFLPEQVRFIPTSEFYTTRKAELLGHSLTIVYLLAFTISIYVLYKSGKRHFSRR